MASATAAVVAGMGLASPAHGDDLVTVSCNGPTFGDRTNTASVGSVLAVVTATGDAFTNLLHDQSGLTFTASCGNGDIRNVGNTTIEWRAPAGEPFVHRRHGHHKKHGGPPPWARD